MSAPSRAPWWFLVTLAAIPCVIACVQLGRIHPDETYQFLEPAFHRAHGYGKLAWEWRDGLRNWAVPGLLGAILRGAGALGITNPYAYRALVEVPVFALHLWMLHALWRHVQWRAPRARLVSLLAVGLYGPLLIFAGRTTSESFSGALLIIALEALDRPSGDDRAELRAGIVGGGALGLAVVARYGSLPFVAAALLWLVVRRSTVRLLYTLAALALVAVGLGLLDLATWGKPLASLIAYARFNFFSGDAGRHFGTEPASWYVRPLLGWTAAWVWLALPLTLRRERLRPSLPLFCALCYLVALIAAPHKEARFLYPGVLVLVLAAIPGLGILFESLPLRVRRRAAVVVVLTSLAHLAVPLDLHGDELRAIVAATRDRNVTGLLVVGENEWGTGGYFTIGKNIPWSTCISPGEPAFRNAMTQLHINRVVTWRGLAESELQDHGFRPVGSVGRFAILAR